MSTPHKATPEQWQLVEEHGRPGIGFHSDSCILELRDRIEALEAAANSKPAPNSGEIRSSQAGGLVERVSEAIVFAMVSSDRQAALAAIHVVIEHLRRTAWHAAADWLSVELEEASRGTH